MGMSAIASWLNQHGYKKKKRQNNALDAFAASFIKGVLVNPIYCGKLAFGRRKNEKVPGTRNEYRIVKQEEYMLNDAVEEVIRKLVQNPKFEEAILKKIGAGIDTSEVEKENYNGQFKKNYVKRLKNAAKYWNRNGGGHSFGFACNIYST